MYRIGFIGKQRAGKDSAAEALIYEYGGGSILQFAAPIKETEAAFWHSLNLPVPDDKAVRRHFLIGLGKLGRYYNNDIYVDAVEREIKRQFSKNIYISDIRFPNEAARLKLLGFTLIKIECDDTVRHARGAGNDNDESETSVDSISPELIDFTVKNDFSNVCDWRKYILKFVDENVKPIQNDLKIVWEGTLFQDIGC